MVLGAVCSAGPFIAEQVRCQMIVYWGKLHQSIRGVIWEFELVCKATKASFWPVFTSVLAMLFFYFNSCRWRFRVSRNKECS
jgi:hypothetical protein